MTSSSLEENVAPVRIGCCHVLRLLITGSSGALYLAKDEQTGQVVVIKSLLLDGRITARDLRTIGRDVLIAANLNHPSVVKIHDSLRDEDRLHLIMEYVMGENLGDRLKAQALTQPQIVKMTLELVAGLSAAHGSGLAHLGLHSGRIMIEADERLRILGLGLGSCYRQENTHSLQALAAMSPEQTRNERLDLRTDFFSLGILIYEMVTRTSPFLGVNREETLYRIHKYLPRPLAQEFPGTHPKLSAIVDWLLQKDPERRPEDCADVVPVLNEVAYDLSRT